MCDGDEEEEDLFPLFDLGQAAGCWVELLGFEKVDRC
jgi:hypothetical protein